MMMVINYDNDGQKTSIGESKGRLKGIFRGIQEFLRAFQKCFSGVSEGTGAFRGVSENLREVPSEIQGVSGGFQGVSKAFQRVLGAQEVSRVGGCILGDTRFQGSFRQFQQISEDSSWSQRHLGGLKDLQGF